MHFHRDRANKRFRDQVSGFPCGVLRLIPDGDPSSATVVIDVKTIATDGRRTSPKRLTMFRRSCWRDPARGNFTSGEGIDSLFPLCSHVSNGRGVVFNEAAN